MKIEIIKEVYAILTIDNDKTYRSDINVLAKYPFKFADPFGEANERFEEVSLLDDGTISLSFKYGKDKDFKLETLILKRDEPLVIEDTFTRWDRDLEKDIPHTLRLELHLEYAEAEVDENNLVLVIDESAEDTSHEEYIDGKQKRNILIKEGEIISANLIKKNQFRLKIAKVDGVNVTLECLDFARRAKYPPYEQIHSVTINQFFLAYFSVDGGYNTRYDYESWHWNLKLQLDIKDGIKFIGE